MRNISLLTCTTEWEFTEIPEKWKLSTFQMCHSSQWCQAARWGLISGWLTWRSSFMARVNMVNRQSWTSRAKLPLAAGCSVVFQCSSLLERCWLRRMKLKVMKWYLTRQEHGSTRRNQWGRKRLLLKTNEAKMDQLPAPFKILFVVDVSS